MGKELDKKVEVAQAEFRSDYFDIIACKLAAWWLDDEEEEIMVEKIITACKDAADYYYVKAQQLKSNKE